MVHDVAGYVHRSPSSKLSVRERHIYDFFVRHPIGILASIMPDGSPHGAAVYYAVDEEFEAAFMTKAGTQKHRNITRCPRVCLTVYDILHQTTGTITGEVVEVTDQKQRDRIAKSVITSSLHTSEAGLIPPAKLSAAPYVAYVIKPRRVRLASYASSHSEAYEEMTAADEYVTSGKEESTARIPDQI